MLNISNTSCLENSMLIITYKTKLFSAKTIYYGFTVYQSREYINYVVFDISFPSSSDMVALWVLVVTHLMGNS